MPHISALRLIGAATIAAATAAAPALAQRAVTAERPFAATGQLEESDPRAGEDSRYDEHRIRLEAGRRYRISASSDEFDTILQLFRPGEDEPVAQDDDGGEGLNSRLSFTPERGGDYVLRVSSFNAEALGSYSVAAELAPPLPPPTVIGEAFETTVWTVHRGALEAGDGEQDDALFDDYLITLAAGEEILVRADSTAFDAFLRVFGADDREGEPLASDDDSGGGLNSMLAFVAPEAGDYVIRVSAYGGGEESGAYRLRIGR